MARIHWQQNINSSAAEAWSVFSEFAEFLTWNKLDVGMEVNGNGIGMVRTLIIEGFGRVGERLDELDHNTRSQRYTLVEGNPLGMQSYSAEIQIKAVDEQNCCIYWVGNFTVVSGYDDAKVGKSLLGSYQGMSDSLAAYIAENHSVK